MELSPKPAVVKELKRQAAKAGLTLNAYLLPYLNDIAEGRRLYSPQYVPLEQVKVG